MPDSPACHLVVSRTSSRDLKFRGIEVYLDGEHFGDFTFGASLEREIKPGKHVLRATNKLKSHSLEFNISPGETIRFEVIGIALAGLWIVMTMMGVVAYKVVLERVDEACREI